MEELRLDEDFLNRELNKALFREFLKRMEYPDEIFLHFYRISSIKISNYCRI